MHKTSQVVDRSRRTDSKNIAYLWFLSRCLEMFGLKFNFFTEFLEYKIALGDFGKMVGVFEQMRSKTN